MRSLTGICGRRRAVALIVAVSTSPAWAQNEARYPDKLIRIVVPLPAGGGVDALSRLVAERIAGAWGQSVIVENKPGATGGIGASAVAQAKPDGYTLLIAIASTIQAITLQKKPLFQLSELAPIAQLADLPTGFAVPASLGVATLADFVKLAASKPGVLTYASVGIGSTGHILGEILASATRIKIVHVPYKGEAPTINDLLGGQISSAFASVGGLGQHPAAIRLLAITGPHRLARFPDVPTFEELGYPMQGLNGWAGAFAPASTPASIVDKLAGELDRIVRTPEMQARIRDFGFEPLGAERVSFASFVRSQAARWAAAAKQVGVEPE